MVMESHAHQGHTRSRRRDEHHQMSMLVRDTDSLSWPWDAEKQKKLFRVWNTSCWVCEAQAVPAVPALPKRLHTPNGSRRVL